MNENKFKVALVTACTAPVPDVRGGGAERLVTMLLDENEIEQKLDFLVFSKPDKLAEERALLYKHSKVVYITPSSAMDKFKNLFIYSTNRIFRKNIFAAGYYRRIASYLKNNRVDIVIDENGYVPDFKIISNLVGIDRSVAHIHWKVNPTNRNIEHNYRYAMGVSEYITHCWIENSGDEEVLNATVKSGVNEKRFLKRITEEEKFQLKNSLGIPQNICVIAYCGRIHEQKGPLELYQAFVSDANVSKKAVLMFIGGSDKQGSELSAYHRELLKETHDDKNVFFTGYVDNDVLYKYYQISDFLVVPTLVEEAAGLVVIEAMLSGLPIIATRSGGLPEYVNSECAILINKDNRMQSELADAMNKLVADKEKRKQMAEAAEIQGKLFTQNCYYNKFAATIDHIMKK